MATDNTKTVKAALAVTFAVADTVRELKRAPAGVVYAALMECGCTLGTFEKICDILYRSGKVRREGDELVWVDEQEGGAS